MNLSRRSRVEETMHRVSLGLSKDEYQKLREYEAEEEERMISEYNPSIKLKALISKDTFKYDKETNRLWKDLDEEYTRYVYDSGKKKWLKLSDDMEEVSMAIMWADITSSIARDRHTVRDNNIEEESAYVKENLMYEEGDFTVLKVIVSDYGSNIAKMYAINDITEKYDHVSFDSQTYELKVKIPMTPGSINRPYTRNDIIKSMSLFDKRFSRISISG